MEAWRFAGNVIAVTLLAASPVELGLLGALAFAGTLMFSAIAGSGADRRSRRRILIGTVLIRVALIAVVPIAFAVDSLTIWVLLAVVGLISVADVFYDAAHFSIVTEIVGPDHVSEAIGRLQATDQVARIGIPGGTGLAIRVVAAPVIVGLSAVIQLVAALLFFWLPRDTPSEPTRPTESFWASVGTGFRFISSHAVIRTFMISSGIMNLAAGILVAVLGLYALRILGLTPAEYGLAMGVGAVGGVVSGLLAARIGRAIGPIRAMLIAGLVMPVPYLLLAAGPPVAGRGFGVLLVSELIFTFMILLYGIQNAGISARVTPPHLMGRVASARRLIAVGTFPLGSILGGVLAEILGVTFTLWVAFAVSLVITAPLWISGLSRHRTLPDQYHVPGDE